MASPPTTRQAVAKLAAGVAIAVALLTWWGGWALPVVVAAILAMIMLHEFGHFLVAKRSGMRVTDFFVGFGPVVWSTTVGETRYGVRAIPAGGYVKVPGMAWSEEVDADDEARTYRSSTYPRKVLFASAGSLTHLLLAVVLAWAALSFVGAPDASKVGVAGFTAWDGHAHTPAQLAGVHVGDQFVSIDGRAITGATELVSIINHHTGQAITIVVARHGADVTLHVTPVDGRGITSGGHRLATGATPKGFIGVDLENMVSHQSVLAAVPHAVGQVGSTIVTAVRSLVHVFSPGEFASLFHQVTTPAVATNPSVQATRPVSIYGITRFAVQAAQSNAGTLLEVLMLVNVFVGLLNLVPMLPLDGGHVAVATYERVRSRRGRRYHADVNRLTPYAYGFMLILLVLFACTLYLDIVHPIANPFR
jgi:membrane-associated protease RseP (regulator of RpoE activity)